MDKAIEEQIQIWKQSVYDEYDKFLPMVLLLIIDEMKELRAEIEELKQGIKPSDSGLIDILELYSHRLQGWQNGNSLYDHCRRIAEEEEIQFPYSSPRSLGNKLHRSWPALVEELSCEKKKGKNNETLYYFSRK